MSERRTLCAARFLALSFALFFSAATWAAWPEAAVQTLATPHAVDVKLINNFVPGESGLPSETPTHMLYSPEDFYGFDNNYYGPGITPVPVPTNTGAPLGSRIYKVTFCE